MLVGKCWATQYNHPNNTNATHHILIQNGWEGFSISTTSQDYISSTTTWLVTHACSSFSLLGAGAQRTQRFHSISLWSRPTAKVLPFALTLRCSASRQNQPSSSCTVQYSCASQMIRSPASLWASGAGELALVIWAVVMPVFFCFFFSSNACRTVIRWLKGRQWEQTPLKACSHTDPSGSKSPRRLTLAVSSWTFLNQHHRL